MNVKGMMKSNKGFSLVELMVVVAIIGILAAIAVPNVNRYMLKSRQGEAKTNLASLYTNERAFFTEHTTYVTDFGKMGFSPEGQIRFNVGFTAAFADGTPVTGNGIMSTDDLCDGTPATATCTRYLTNGATNLPALAMATAIVAAGPPQTFVAEARAAFDLYGGASNAVFTINQQKSIVEVSSGL